MEVIINYDKVDKEYKLYVKDLDVLLKSSELFTVIVMFDEVLKSTGLDINVLNSDDIEYILDSSSLKQMISSNVKLIKKLSRMPSDFQRSVERFGSTSQQSTIGNQLSRSQSKTNKWDNLMSKKL